jgi:hypothetical protein
MSGPRKRSPQGDGRLWTVFVRFPDQKTAQRITPDDHSTRRRVHAAQFTTAERAKQVAATRQAYLDEHHSGCRVWAGPF